MCVSASPSTVINCLRLIGRWITISSPILRRRCVLAVTPLTLTLPFLHAFCASERVLNRQATSSHWSRRTVIYLVIFQQQHTQNHGNTESQKLNGFLPWFCAS